MLLCDVTVTLIRQEKNWKHLFSSTAYMFPLENEYTSLLPAYTKTMSWGYELRLWVESMSWGYELSLWAESMSQIKERPRSAFLYCFTILMPEIIQWYIYIVYLNDLLAGH